jgi:hypothetical protein
VAIRAQLGLCAAIRPLDAEVTDVVLSEGSDYERIPMPMTQLWVRFGDDWKCLSGHARPRLI